LLKFFHNPSCSKSRAVLELLQNAQKEFCLVEYLKNPPEREEIDLLVELLDERADKLLRKKEKLFLEMAIPESKLTPSQVAALIEKHPILMERPVVMTEQKALICRPPNKVFDLL
jgi:arsenate reductase